MRGTRSLSIVLLMVAGVAMAEPGGMGVTVKVGTPGIGVDVTVGLSEKTNLRLSGNGLSYTYDDFDFDDEENPDGSETIDQVEATLDLLTIGGILDWHPWAGSFRLSVGAFYNGNEASLSVQPGDTVEFNGIEYQVQSLDGSIQFDGFSPYVGLGWGNGADTDGHWHFAFDLGVMFHGNPEIELSATASDPTLQAMLNRDLNAEIEELEDDAEVFSIYPVIALGLTYTF